MITEVIFIEGVGSEDGLGVDKEGEVDGAGVAVTVG